MGVQVNIVGIVGKECEVRQSRSGNRFATFTLGTKSYHNGEEEMSWFNVIDNTPHVVNVLSPMLKKGSLINVIGEEFVQIKEYKGKPILFREIRANTTTLINYPKKPQNKEEKKVDKTLAIVMKQAEEID